MINTAASIKLGEETYLELYVTSSDVEGYMLAQRLRENTIDAWTGGRAGKFAVVYVSVADYTQARAIRERVFGIYGPCHLCGSDAPCTCHLSTREEK